MNERNIAAAILAAGLLESMPLGTPQAQIDQHAQHAVMTTKRY
jgi:hypothetical protein